MRGPNSIWLCCFVFHVWKVISCFNTSVLLWEAAEKSNAHDNVYFHCDIFQDCFFFSLKGDFGPWVEVKRYALACPSPCYYMCSSHTMKNEISQWRGSHSWKRLPFESAQISRCCFKTVMKVPRCHAPVLNLHTRSLPKQRAHTCEPWTSLLSSTLSPFGQGNVFLPTLTSVDYRPLSGCIWSSSSGLGNASTFSTVLGRQRQRCVCKENFNSISGVMMGFVSVRTEVTSVTATCLAAKSDTVSWVWQRVSVVWQASCFLDWLWKGVRIPTWSKHT